jgi:hypothetical protein
MINLADGYRSGRSVATMPMRCVSWEQPQQAVRSISLLMKTLMDHCPSYKYIRSCNDAGPIFKCQNDLGILLNTLFNARIYHTTERLHPI